MEHETVKTTRNKPKQAPEQARTVKNLRGGVSQYGLLIVSDVAELTAEVLACSDTMLRIEKALDDGQLKEV